MLKSGDIVVQDCTMISNRVDSYKSRLSVVLFEFEIDKEMYSCTAPLTNNPRSALKYNDSYYYFPYLIYEQRKYSCVKINAANLYPSKSIHSTGISLDNNHMDRIFDKIINYSEPKKYEELYKMIRDNISIVKRINKTKETEEKQKRKRLRQEKRRNAKKGINTD